MWTAAIAYAALLHDIGKIAPWLNDVQLARIGDKIAGAELGWHRFVQDVEKESPWRAVDSASVAGYLADVQPAFATVMLTTWTEDQADDALYICDSMYWDIDRDGRLDEAITAAAKLVAKLAAHGVPVDAIRAHCSGGKGFHLEVPLTAFLSQGVASLSVEEMRVLPAIFKEIAYKVFVDGVDSNVYSAKRGRQWRRAGGAGDQQENSEDSDGARRGLLRLPVVGGCPAGPRTRTLRHRRACPNAGNTRIAGGLTGSRLLVGALTM